MVFLKNDHDLNLLHTMSQQIMHLYADIMHWYLSDLFGILISLSATNILMK